MSKTLIIGEPGGTHQGQHSTILRLIEAAAAAGASCFKNQWTSSPREMIARRGVPTEPYHRYYGWLQYPLDWHAEFRDRCHALGLQYACSVYLPADARVIAPCVDFIKIASFEASDPELLVAALLAKRTAAVNGLVASDVIVSTGMSDNGSRDYRVQMNRVLYAPRALLHCTSSYPTPLDEMNISVLSGGLSGQRYRGLSDHSRNLIAGGVAVACGAEIIEAHFRLDTCATDNPDYQVSFSPAEFKQYVDNIRTAETLLGSGEKRVQLSELPMLAYRVSA